VRIAIVLALCAAPAAAERVDSPGGKQFAAVERNRATLHRAADAEVIGAALVLPTGTRRVRVLDDHPMLLAFSEKTVAALHADGRSWTADRGDLEFVVEPFDVLVLINGKSIRALSLESGAARPAKSPIALLGTRRGTERERHDALAACAIFLPDGTVDAMKRVLEDRRVELDLHAHAAIVMERAGGKIDPKPYVQRAFDGPVSDHVLLYAHEYLGAETIPHLIRFIERAPPGIRQRRTWGVAVVRGGGIVRGGAEDALVAIGAPAVDPMLERLVDQRYWVRHAAVRVLARLKAERAFGALLTRAKVDNTPIARDALNGCLAIAPAGLPRALSALLANRSPVADRIVYHFEKHPHPDAIPGLQAEHDRSRSQSWRRHVKRVIRACEAAGAGKLAAAPGGE
jgi:hypothetical protein